MFVGARYLPGFSSVIIPFCDGSAVRGYFLRDIGCKGPESIIVNSMLVFLNGIRFDGIYTINLWKEHQEMLDPKKEQGVGTKPIL